MNHLCDIWTKSELQDPVTGEMRDVWFILHSDVWCDINPLSARDFVQSKADQSGISVRVTIPWISGITEENRIIATCDCHADRVYSPAGALEDNITGSEYITLPCSYRVRTYDEDYADIVVNAAVYVVNNGIQVINV